MTGIPIPEESAQCMYATGIKKFAPIASSNMTQSETPRSRDDEGNNHLIPNGSPGMGMGRWGKLLCDVAHSRKLCWVQMVRVKGSANRFAFHIGNLNLPSTISRGKERNNQLYNQI